MSIDINWHTLTDGPDGERLAESIRAFVNERFQQIPLPRLIRSVKVQGFDFGKVAPQITLKDICEPLPDFYETDGDEEGGDGASPAREGVQANTRDKAANHLKTARDRMDPLDPSARGSANERNGLNKDPTRLHGTATPGFLHGTSNLGYFHLPLSAGLSGTNTPLAAVAGAHFNQAASLPEQNLSQASQDRHHSADSFNSVTPPPTLTPPSRPTSRDDTFLDQHRGSVLLDDMDDSAPRTPPAEPERSPEDLQIIFHVSYSGDIKLSMTAEVFLDYPMPSFVGIPLKLNITGLTFDGVGIVAYIKRKAHVCFLAPEDAEALVGVEAADLRSPTDIPSPGHTEDRPRTVTIGGLIEDIKIESEMGGSDGGKQVLKNVGKIEKFILEQVQRIFEDEFVYPSFWTFLV